MSASRFLDQLPLKKQPSKFPTITIAVGGEEVLAAELPAGRYTVGGSPMSDFCLPMLSEDQLCILECKVDSDGERIILENISPSLYIGGKKTSAATQEVALTSPLHLEVDDVVIEIRSQRVVRNYVPAYFFVGAALLLLAGWWVGSPSNIGMTPMQSVVSRIGDPLLTSDAVMAELRSRINQSDLTGRLTVHNEGAGVIVRGQLPRSLTTLWRETLVNIRQRAQIRVSADIAPIPQEADGRAEIAGVLLEPRRAVMGSDDKARLEGEELPSGWVIESISARSVRLGREGLVDNVSLPEAPVQAAGG